MIINIYLPEDVYKKKRNETTQSEKIQLFGEIKFECNRISYFIISDEPTKLNLRLLGYIQETNNGNEDVSLIFNYDNDENGLYLSHMNISSGSSSAHCNIYIYEKSVLEKLSFPGNGTYFEGFDLHFLKKLCCNANKKSNPRQILILKLQNFLFRCFYVLCQILPKFFRRSSLYKHVSYYNNLKKEKRNWSTLMDVMLGLIMMYFTLHYLRNNDNEPILQVCHYIIQQIRKLLRSLKGEPIGLKLNLQLNTFLLDVFTYHIDLWANFLILISPVIRNLLLSFAVFGILGFTFQLALLSDLLFLTTVHANCFHVYTTFLYKIEKVGIKVFWKTAIGMKENILKNRMESFEQQNRQYYLVSLFLTCLLFLMPTIFIYYIVFVFIRFGIYLCNCLLQFISQIILESQIDEIIDFLFLSYFDVNDIDIKFIKIVQKDNSNLTTSIFKICMKCKLPRKSSIFPVKQIHSSNKAISIKEFFENVIKGKAIDME